MSSIYSRLFLNSTSGLARFLPEPRNSGGAFGKLLDTARSLTGASSVVDISPEYRDLLLTQMEVQQQMQQISMHSNIEKSKHETRMAAIRNVRTA